MLKVFLGRILATISCADHISFFYETKPDKLQTEKLLMLCKSGIAVKCSLWQVQNVLDLRSNVFYMHNHYVGLVFSLYDERLLVGIFILLFSPFR